MDQPVAFPGWAFSGGTFDNAFAENPYGLGLNNLGDVMFRAKGSHPNAPLDQFDAVFINEQLIADNDMDAVIPRTTYAFGGVGVALNDAGQHAFVTGLIGDGFSSPVIIRNDEIVVSPIGLNIPGLDKLPSVGRLQLDQSGNVIWSGSWLPEGASEPISGIFWNESLLIQTGVTEIDGLILESINQVQASDNGEWVSLVGDLEDGSRHVIRVNIPAPGSASVLSIAVLALRRRNRPTQNNPNR